MVMVRGFLVGAAVGTAAGIVVGAAVRGRGGSDQQLAPLLESQLAHLSVRWWWAPPLALQWVHS